MPFCKNVEIGKVHFFVIALTNLKFHPCFVEVKVVQYYRVCHCVQK